jgi:hypothetical protein
VRACVRGRGLTHSAHGSIMASMLPRTNARRGRKLLIASIGVATMSYVATSCGTTTGPADGRADVMNDIPVANLVAPPVDVQGQDGQPQDVQHHDTRDDFPVANLVAPPVDGH